MNRCIIPTCLVQWLWGWGSAFLQAVGSLGKGRKALLWKIHPEGDKHGEERGVTMWDLLHTSYITEHSSHSVLPTYHYRLDHSSFTCAAYCKYIGRYACFPSNYSMPTLFQLAARSLSSGNRCFSTGLVLDTGVCQPILETYAHSHCMLYYQCAKHNHGIHWHSWKIENIRADSKKLS